ncbi:VWA domain-containing protein [Marimonas lutisalis]|uniref:VWA domain-containing protein n=1 Tax=Marimonas lutisalis TaxID=2545756 RepID=UPI0013762809|nr:VWA domain-containing protein [Marimonas lutisalis]
MRLTSVGEEGYRDDSLKIVGDAPYINLPPDAYDDGTTADDRIVVESDDSISIDLLANDEDRDGALDPASLTIVTNGSLGTGIVNAGQIDYAANDVGDDSTDDSGVDQISYTVDDTEGATSNVATAYVHVIDPLVETDSDSADAANGQTITLSMTTEDRTYNDESEVAVAINFGALEQHDVNVSFVIDGSGSITPSEWSEQIQAVQDTIDLLRSQFDGTGTDVEIQLVEFWGLGTGNPAPDAIQATYSLSDGALDDVTTGTPLTTQRLGGTNYEAGLRMAEDFVVPQTGDENYMVFISDGEPNRAYQLETNTVTIGSSSESKYIDEVLAIEGAGTSIIAIGFGGANVARLKATDNTGGAEVYANASQLGTALGTSPLFPADVIEFSLTVNGGASIADVTDLVPTGGGDLAYTGDLTGLDNSHGATNTVVATAGFDVDGDGIFDECWVAETVIDGTDGSDIFLWA